MAAARRPSLRQSSSRSPRGSDENIKTLKFTRHAPWRLTGLPQLRRPTRLLDVGILWIGCRLQRSLDGAPWHSTRPKSRSGSSRELSMCGSFPVQAQRALKLITVAALAIILWKPKLFQRPECWSS